MKKDYLKMLREIKSVAFATADNNVPHVRVADIMMVEDGKIYFTTARGKGFYEQLIKNPVVAIVGMTPTYETIRITGKVKKLDDRIWVDKIFEHNPMMNDLYSGEKRDILDAFCIEEGTGESFNLSVTPPVRERFAFGGAKVVECGYRITEKCTGCGTCRERCPESAIIPGDIYKINKEICLECGRCAESCPAGAIEKPVIF